MPNFTYRGFYVEASRNDNADTVWFCEVFYPDNGEGVQMVFRDTSFETPEDAGDAAVRWIDKNKHRIAEWAEEM